MTTSERSSEDKKPTATAAASKRSGSTVGQIMTRDPKAVTPDTPIQQIASLMMECDCGSIPVIDSQNTKKIVGMVTDRDIVVRLVAKGADLGKAKAADVMTNRVHSVRENDSVDQVHQVMGKNQVRRVPVVDSRDCLVGIVALADVANSVEQNRGDRETKLAGTVEEISETGKGTQPRA